MKHLFIINPVSGGKEHDPENTRKLIEKAVSDLTDDYEIYFTKAPLDACTKIRNESTKCDDLRVYSCGGDGTLNECVNAAVGASNIAVTQFPCGTGNDFLRVFGDELDRFKDFKALINGDIHKIDTIKCNDRYCVNICSVGLDARVGTDVHKYSRLPLCHGAFGYVVSLIVNIFKGLSSKMYVRNNDKLYSGQMTLVCACNGRFYGGGFNPVPEAKIDDGKMDVLVISKVPALKLAPLLLKYAKGKYKEVKRYVTHLETFKVEITAEKEFVVNVDGEAMRTEKVIFELIPKSLNLITPKNMKFWN